MTLKAISAYGKTWIIAFSMASGLTLVLIPGGTLLWFLFFIPLVLVRINLTALIGTMVLGRIFVSLIDPYTERLGYYLLTRDFLYEPMGRLLSIPLLGWLRLDDSLVFGGFFVGIVGWPLFFLLFLFVVSLYRKFVGAKVRALFRFLGAKIPLFGKQALAATKAAEIPPRFRRPLSRLRYRAMLFSNRDDLSLLKSVFSLGEDGKYHYQNSLDQKTAESAAALLKKTRIIGPNTVRILFVALIIGLPILFNILFLDKLAARQLEKFLETLGRTDVTVEGLDIAPLAARIRLDRLGFASKSDPMLDRWQVQNLVSDVSWNALFFRRFVLEELRGTGAVDVARETPAVYPTAEVKLKLGNVRKFSGTDWMPGDAIPNESVNLIKSLRGSYETEYDGWILRVEKDIASAMSLSERVEALVSETLPESVDGWIVRVGKGRDIAAEINSTIRLLETYKRDLDVTLRDATSAFEHARAAMERDLALIEKTLGLDSEILELWLQSVIDELFGSRLGAAYRQIASSFTDFPGLRRGQDETRKKGRMKQGRIVHFPVRLPPRFSIETLEIGGEGVHIVGENIGIDHDLAGMPSHLLMEFSEIKNLDTLTADITVDGRTGSENLVSARIDFDGWDWSMNYEDWSGEMNSIGGLLGASVTFSAVRTSELNLAGLARLTDWKEPGDEGFFSFVRESSPPLGFRFEARFSERNPEFKISVIEKYLQDWLALLSDTLLLEGKERAKRLLLDNVSADLEGFDALLVDWNEQEEFLSVTLEQLITQNVNLNESIAQWAEHAAGGLVPSSELLEGVRSLF